jgi:hypothetical protein
MLETTYQEVTTILWIVKLSHLAMQNGKEFNRHKNDVL